MAVPGEQLLGLGTAGPSASEARDAQVIECAAALFLKEGIASVRMVDIADAAGVGVATLYRRFSTKTRLAIAAGTLIWQRFNQRIVQVVESDRFLALGGADRLELLLREYAAHLASNPEFVNFVSAFDHLMIQEGVGADELAGYGREVDSFFIIFADAYQLGLADGSVRHLDDFRTCYRSMAHALMGVAEKIFQGEVIPSDDFRGGRSELACLVEMAVHCIRA